jgi:predicted RNase H-like nuclease (RuvC/YqgF family)
LTNPIPEYIDKQKLLEWAKKEFYAAKERNDEGAMLAYQNLKYALDTKEIESGTFDDHSAQEEIAKLKIERDWFRTHSKTMTDVCESFREDAKKFKAERDEWMQTADMLKFQYGRAQSQEARAIQAEKEWDELKQDVKKWQNSYADLRKDFFALKEKSGNEERERDEEREGETQHLDYVTDNLNGANATIAEISEVNNALLEGLKWYADYTNYDPYRWQSDDGRRARSIIAKLEGSKPE